jgi:hypothetical protein
MEGSLLADWDLQIVGGVQFMHQGFVVLGFLNGGELYFRLSTSAKRNTGGQKTEIHQAASGKRVAGTFSNWLSSA